MNQPKSDRSSMPVDQELDAEMDAFVTQHKDRRD